MRVVYEPGQEANTYASVAHVQWVQQMAKEFVTRVSEAQRLLDDLCMKFVTPAE